jgi:sulfonate transport system substrate-binding protein
MTEDEMREYARRVGMDSEALAVVLEQKEDDYKPRVLDALERLDEGTGADVMRLFETLQLPDAVVDKQLKERTELIHSKIGAPQRESILAAGIALQQAGVIKPDIDVKKALDDLIDEQYVVVTN